MVDADISVDQVNIDLVDSQRGPRSVAPLVSLMPEADMWDPGVDLG